MGDLVRGAILSIPKHQFESGTALALKASSLLVYNYSANNKATYSSGNKFDYKE